MRWLEVKDLSGPVCQEPCKLHTLFYPWDHTDRWHLNDTAIIHTDFSADVKVTWCQGGRIAACGFLVEVVIPLLPVHGMSLLWSGRVRVCAGGWVMPARYKWFDLNAQLVVWNQPPWVRLDSLVEDKSVKLRWQQLDQVDREQWGFYENVWTSTLKGYFSLQ